MPWSLLVILFAVCAAFCAVGFYKFVYFLSVGYGSAVAGGGVAVLVMALRTGTEAPLWIIFIQAVLFLVYGTRLAGFLLIRELKNASYQKTLKEATGNEKKMPLFSLVLMWLMAAALYTAQVSPMLFRVANDVEGIILPVIGFVISALGIVIEAVADSQKSAQKKERPDMVATKGLYKICRCPNYLGEVLFWTGVFISGINAYKTFGQWLMALIAYVCIVYVMFNGAQRLEKRQVARYGALEEYNEYANKTPIIIPFVPLYHLNKKQ